MIKLFDQYSVTEHSRAIAAQRAATDFHERLKWLADVAEANDTKEAWQEVADRFDAWIEDELMPLLKRFDESADDAAMPEWLRYQRQKERQR